MSPDVPPVSNRRDASLWLGVLGPPVLWATQFGAAYALVPWACAHGARWLLPFVAGVSLLLVFAVGGMCWRLRRSWDALHFPREAESPVTVTGRARFMALLGLILSAFFALVICAQAVAVVFLDPCAH